MKFGTWLLSMAQPLLAKILLSLGFSVVSIVGMDLVVTQVKGLLMEKVTSLPAEMLGLFQLAGGGVALGILFGAIATKIMLWQVMNSTKILGTSTT